MNETHPESLAEHDSTIDIGSQLADEERALAAGQWLLEEKVPSPPVQRIINAMDDLKAMRTFVANELKPGIDYGEIPGTTDKKVLLLPGMEKTCMFFNVRPDYQVKRIELGEGHLEVYSRCNLIHRASHEVVGQGEGSCTSMETKFRFRQMERVCPECDKATIYKGKKFKPADPETWFCWKKKGGCGKVFAIDDPQITSQEVGQKENPNIWDTRNNVLKQGLKRSMGKAVQGLGCLSELFTTDLEDFFDLETKKEEPKPPKEQAPEEEKSVAGKAILDLAAEEFLSCEDYGSLLSRFERDETAAHRFGIWDEYTALKSSAFRALKAKNDGEPLVALPVGYEPYWLEFHALDEAYRRGDKAAANRIYLERKDKIPGDAWKEYAKELKGAVKEAK